MASLLYSKTGSRLIPKPSRDLERKDIMTLGEEELNLINQLRLAANRTHKKILTLEEKVEEREDRLAEETQTRVAMEKRMSSCLVDMYSSEGLHAELHDRLRRHSPSSARFQLLDTDGSQAEKASPISDDGEGGRPPRSPLDRYFDFQRSAPDISQAVEGRDAHWTTVNPSHAMGLYSGLGDSRDTMGRLQRDITSLRSELDAAREHNRQLKNRLADAEGDITSLQIECQNKEAEVEARVAEKVAEMVAEIHSAQKARDEAMMSRLRLANDERDAAVMQRASSGPMGLSDIRSGKHYPESDMANIELLLTKLEAEGYDGGDDYLNDIPTKEFSLHDESRVRQLTVERDTALTKVSRLEDELQTLRVYYSLHKSLSVNPLNTSSDLSGSHALVQQLRDVTTERDRLLDQLHRAEDRIRTAEANAEKLGRLVSVLQRKLNSFGPVVEEEV